jgi:hypothetical protein
MDFTITVSQCGTSGCGGGGGGSGLPPPNGLDPGGPVSYLQTDAHGSVRLVTDEQGAQVARCDYLPFGEPWGSAPATSTLQFGGKERDTATEFGGAQALDYFGALTTPARRGGSPRSTLGT